MEGGPDGGWVAESASHAAAGMAATVADSPGGAAAGEDGGSVTPSAGGTTSFDAGSVRGREGSMISRPRQGPASGSRMFKAVASILTDLSKECNRLRTCLYFPPTVAAR